MNTYSFGRVLLVSSALALTPALNAQAPAAAPAKADPVAEAAFDAFFKLRDQQGAVPSAERFDQLIKSGMPLLTKYPKNRRAGNVVGKLGDVAQGINDKKLLPLRDVWFSQLNFAIINARQSAEDDDGKAAVMAVAAANANAQARLIGDKDSFEAAREKIDALAAQPGGDRFIADQEMNFVEVLKMRNPPMAEKVVVQLKNHKNKTLAARATDELRIMEVRKTPFELKFTSADGTAFDAVALRGKKAIFLHYWSVDNEASVKEFDALKEKYFEQRQRVEIVSVNLDPAEKREAVDKVIKDKKVKWPQLVEGLGVKSEVAARINIRSAPNGAMLNQAGMLAVPRARAWQLEAELKKMGFKF
jgi:hypothetical protein